MSEPNQPSEPPIVEMAEPPTITAAPTQPETTPPDEAPSPAEQSGPTVDRAGVARNSAVMAAGSMASRITGFVRTAILGAALSGAVVADSYQVANTLPGMIYELLLGGVLASVVVPLIVKARKTDADHGEAYVHRLLTAATLVLGAATLLAILAAPLLTSVIVSDTASAQQERLVVWLSYLLLPEIFCLGIVAILGAILNTRGYFAAPTWAPIVNNAVVIGTAVVFMLLPGPGIPTPATITPTQVLVLGVGTTLGVFAQAAALWPTLRRAGFVWRWRFDFAQARLGEVGRLAGWMLCYVAVSQVGVFVITALAYRAAERDAPGPFIFNNAYLLFMMVHGIVAVSVITALLPQMSAAAVDSRWRDVSEHLSLGIRLSSVVLVPATAAYLALGIPLAVTAFQWGDFTNEMATQTGWATVAAGTGLVPFAISQLQIFAFYSMRDTRTPALINIPVMAVKLAIDIVLYYTLPAKYLVAGLMIGNTVSFFVAVILGGWFLRRRLGPLGLNRIAQTLTRLGLAALLAGLIAAGIAFGIVTWFGGGKLGSGLALVIGGSALIAAYVAGTVFVRVREVASAWDMIKRKLARA